MTRGFFRRLGLGNGVRIRCLLESESSRGFTSPFRGDSESVGFARRRDPLSLIGVTWEA